MDPKKPALNQLAEAYRPNQKRSLVINGHATSVALEPIFWKRLEAIAKNCDMSLAELIEELDQVRGTRQGGLASFLRFVAVSLN